MVLSPPNYLPINCNHSRFYQIFYTSPYSHSGTLFFRYPLSHFVCIDIRIRTEIYKTLIRGNIYYLRNPCKIYVLRYITDPIDILTKWTVPPSPPAYWNAQIQFTINEKVNCGGETSVFKQISDNGSNLLSPLS